MRISKRVARGVAGSVVALVAGGAVALSPATPAAAASYNGACEGGEVCLWDLTGYNGAMADFYDNVSNYGNWHFYNSSIWLYNRADSAKNQAYWSCLSLFDSANYQGAEMVLMFHNSERGNLDGARNRAESHKFANSFPAQCGDF